MITGQIYLRLLYSAGLNFPTPLGFYLFCFLCCESSSLFFHLMTLHFQYLAQSFWRWYDIMITFSLKSPRMLSREQQEYRQRRDGAHKHNPNSLRLQLMNLLQFNMITVQWSRGAVMRMHTCTHAFTQKPTFVSVHTFFKSSINDSSHAQWCHVLSSVPLPSSCSTGWFSGSLWVQACRWTRMSSVLLFFFF